MLEAKQLNKSIPIPLYFQLKTILLDGIKNGEYPIDSPIPTEKDLSEMFGISRTTVRQAITEMVQEGWLYRIASKGTFVARLKIRQDFTRKLESFNDQIARTGSVPSTKLIAIQKIQMPSIVAAKFHINPTEDFVYIYRQRFVDNEPLVTVETYLPYDKCSFVMSHDFTMESLYKIIAVNDQTRICRATRTLEAVEATSTDARMLGIQKGKPVQLFSTIGYNRADEPIEYSMARYRGDRNRFEIELYT